MYSRSLATMGLSGRNASASIYITPEGKVRTVVTVKNIKRTNNVAINPTSVIFMPLVIFNKVDGFKEPAGLCSC